MQVDTHVHIYQSGGFCSSQYYCASVGGSSEIDFNDAAVPRIRTASRVTRRRYGSRIIGTADKA